MVMHWPFQPQDSQSETWGDELSSGVGVQVNQCEDGREDWLEKSLLSDVPYEQVTDTNLITIIKPMARITMFIALPNQPISSEDI